MNWDEVEKILDNMHCRACDGFGCDHGDRVADALAALKELAAQQSFAPDSLKAVVNSLPKSPKTGKPLLVKGG